MDRHVYNECDETFAALFPLIRAPLGAPTEPLAASGERYHCTSNGLLLEVRRPWIHAVVPLTSKPVRQIPFGAGPKVGVYLLCGLPPDEYFTRFTAAAKAAMPNETAAWVTWNDKTHQWAYREVEVLEHTDSSVRYQRPTLLPHEHLVVDMHSHGVFPAGFSPKDHQDDHGALQVSYCVGSLDREQPTKASCVRVLGVTLPGTAIKLGGAHAPK